MKVFRMLLPAVADKLVGTSPLQSLEPFGKVLGLNEGFKVLAQLCVCLVEVAIQRLFFQGPMHPFNLPICPRVIGLRQPPEECASVPAFRAFGQFSKDKLGRAVNGHKEFQRALLGSDMAPVDVEVTDGIGLEPLLLGRSGQSILAASVPSADH